ncbi:MAG: 4Fe-4S binding protein [Leptospira sp.]|jgi:Ni,Fe-hydrogenase III small subunit/ferredoxin-like protein FixX|nr:4Fe-4S binding protein [Leptospira sp.]
MRSLLELINLVTKKRNLDFSKLNPIHPVNRGIPVVNPKSKTSCGECKECVDVCPTQVIQKSDNEVLEFDYGKCLQCGICVAYCPSETLINSGFTFTFGFKKEELQITYKEGQFFSDAKNTSRDVPKSILDFRQLTNGKGFTYREVSTSGNNSVEAELGASFNSVFDSEGLGIRVVASPKHADAILFSGPVPTRMIQPLQKAFSVTPDPKILIACGTEAVSGGIYEMGERPKEPDLWIAGDPPRPDVILSAFLLALGRISFHFKEELHKFLETLK